MVQFCKGAAAIIALSAFPHGSISYQLPSHQRLSTITSTQSRTPWNINSGSRHAPSFLNVNKLTTTTSASSTSLSMGFVEDFMTGRDDETRRVANEKYIAELQERVKRINELESTVEELGDEEMVAKTMEFRERLKKGEDINGKILEEAFAVVREAAW
jgi:hypothetical protein